MMVFAVRVRVNGAGGVWAPVLLLLASLCDLVYYDHAVVTVALGKVYTYEIPCIA